MRFVLFICCVSLWGCVLPNRLGEPAPFPESRLDFVEIGVTSKDEISEEFGAQSVEHGTADRWGYQAWQRETEVMVAVVMPTGGTGTTFPTGYLKHTLIFDFDPDGLVEGYAVCVGGELHRQKGTTEDCIAPTSADDPIAEFACDYTKTVWVDESGDEDGPYDLGIHVRFAVHKESLLAYFEDGGDGFRISMSEEAVVLRGAHEEGWFIGSMEEELAVRTIKINRQTGVVTDRVDAPPELAPAARISEGKCRPLE